MKQKYYIVKDDVFGIVNKLRTIDPGYYILYFPKQKTYQVHYGYGENSYQLTFDVLDKRIIQRVCSTRITKDQAKIIFQSMDRHNQQLEEKILNNQVDQAKYQLKQLCGYFERHTDAMQ